VQEVVRLAFKYAESDMPGATHITLPVNIAGMQVAEGDVPLKHSYVELDERAEWGSIDRAAALIKQGKKTVILAGNGAVRNHAGAALTRLAEAAHLPVINTMMAKGVIRCDNPYSCSTVGLPFRDFGNLILAKADTIVAVGYDLVELDPSSWNKECNTHIIHIATLPADVNKYYQADVQVVGSLSPSLDGITSLLSGFTSDSKWALDIRKMAQENDEEDKKDSSFPAKPQRIIADVRSVMAAEDILVSDVGANKVWVAREFPCYQPNTCLISNGFASMGFCLPGTIAAKLVYPERHIVGITGDGGFLMNCQELETAVRMKLPVVIVIMHDDSYGLIKWKEMNHFGSSCFVDYGDPDFVAFAESFGAKGYRVTRTEELVPILKDAFSQTVPSVIDCPVDYRENLRLEARMKEICSQK
jgi:acetolactate synthase-1/2/3 large subunit